MAVVASSMEGRRQGSPELGGSRLRMPAEYGRFSSRGAFEKPITPASRRNSISTPTACSSPTMVCPEVGGGTSNGSGHIRVAVRVRPLPLGEAGIIEVAGEGAIAIRKEAATGGNQFLTTQQGRVEERSFDRVFGPDARQEEVYAWTCEPLIEDAMTQGRNATVFVYGATGAGKTHTMFGAEGEEDQQGIIFRAVRDVFEQIDSHRHRSSGSDDDDLDSSHVPDEADRFEVRVSFLELYNEVVRDLLQEGAQSNCRVLEDERRGVVQVSNLVEVLVHSADEALSLLRAGMEARTIEATAANNQSSRAHAVFALTVERVRPAPQRRGTFKSRNAEARIPHSKISLIDLAGSERAKDTHNLGSALKDGARINQSLLALANCIDALTAKGGREGAATSASLRKKPPYRDSKLTLMLKGSLTGDGLVAMVANVHPGRSHFEDSNNTLEYAMRASTVKPRRRARQSMPATPSPFQMEFTNGRTQIPSRVRRSATDAVDQVVDEDPHCGMASSSTLPPPTAAATERARLRSKRATSERLSQATPKESEPKCAASAWANKERGYAEMRITDSAESTASSPGHVSPTDDQECLSELSLPDDRDVIGDSEECIGCDCGSETEQILTTDSHQDSSGSDPDGVEQHKVELPGDLNTFAAQVIESLHAEKVDFDERLRAVILERDALQQDKVQLEQENARLRAANLEKDRQLAFLLSGRALTQSMDLIRLE